MRRPILLLIIMAIAYSQSEIMSPDIIKGVAFLLLFSAALLILLIWLVRRLHSNHRRGDGDRMISVVAFLVVVKIMMAIVGMAVATNALI